MTYRLGIDAGSKTIKLVILNEDNQTIFSQYTLHKSDIITTCKAMLHDTLWRFGDAEVTVCVTGSAGIRLAELLNVSFVQEVISTRHALAHLIPEADVAIELGGEDAKIIYLSNGVEQRMNGSCAGGTGGFIDLMCTMLGVRAKQFDSLARGYQMIYPIASRCAVFAQTDVRPLLNEGARRNDIAASILQAVVTQTVAGLSCGRPITGTVVFLGGPFEVYSELVSRFRQTLNLTHSQSIKPRDAHLFVAKGAALFGAGETKTQTQTQTLQSLLTLLEGAPAEEDGGIGRLRPLFADADELEAFKLRHAKNKVQRSRLVDATGSLFVGIDAGSTTVKLAVLNEEGKLVYSSYEKSNGDVIGTVREVLDGLYRSLPHEYGGDPYTTIKHVKVCGYGEHLLQVAFAADSGVVETIAHLRAAQELQPEVDFVLDIGGQDIKCMRIKAGKLDDIMLNEACSSGCGALIEGFSRSLGFTKWSFSGIALSADKPVDLGTRCTVFMTSRVRHAQKEGISAADISAGLAYSVVRNALYKVIGCSDPATLGNRVVVQGGTFKSDAVLRAFELESGLDVIRPDIAELMGAYGAALLARDENAQRTEESHVLTPLELASLNQKQTTRHCQACTNNCLLTINAFPPRETDELSEGTPRKERIFIVGNRCERGSAGDLSIPQSANLFVYERELLAGNGFGTSGFPETREPEASEPFPVIAATIGIPMILDVFETYPFWSTFFRALGLRVICAQSSGSTLYQKGAHAVLSEGTCYPAKLAHGHISQLIEQGVDYLFMPKGGAVASVTSTLREPKTRQGIECPVSSNYATLIAEGVEQSNPTIGFLTCDLSSETPLAIQMFESLAHVGLTETQHYDLEQVDAALTKAFSEQEEFYKRLAEHTSQVLARLESEDLQGIVLVGHPYHVDADLSHGVDNLLVELGFPVLSATGLLALRKPPLSASSRSGVAGVWTKPQALYQVASLVAEHERLNLVHLYSFGCGVDALITRQMRSILEAADKPYTALKIDEMVDTAAIRIRLRSLADVLKARQQQQSCQERGCASLSGVNGEPSRVVSSPSCQSTPTLIMPSLAPQHLAAVQQIVEDAGYRLAILPEMNAHDIEAGLRHLNNDLCYPLLAVAGQVMRFAATYQGNGPLTVLVPQICSGCKGIELEQLIRQHLKIDKQNSNIKILGIPSRNELFTVPAWLATRIYDALVATDAKSARESSRRRGGSTTPKPRVGVIGNAGMVYTPQLNNRIVQQIEAEGCEPHLAAITDLLTTNAPLERLAGSFVEQGILDIIFLQSFGCLTSHIHGRGAAKRLKKLYPDLNISFIDYDAGASSVNQTSRLKLALTIAKERVGL
jgi:predicted CoA-substrate-specific enzyme activase